MDPVAISHKQKNKFLYKKRFKFLFTIRLQMRCYPHYNGEEWE